MPGGKDQGKNINEARKVHQSTERSKELIRGSHSNSNKHSLLYWTSYRRWSWYEKGKGT